ncbi:MAG: hypothetical protein AAF591_09630 [Verrucomicrobiota bacterium]
MTMLFRPISQPFPLLATLAFLLPAATEARESPTFAEDIAPIIHQRCSECHRPGEAAPFALIDYDDVKRRSKTIQRVISDRYMPPWHPVPGHGDFRGERRLSDDEIATFNQWINAGTPLGNPELAPEPPQFPKGWQLGEPDLVLTMDSSYAVPADGPDLYRSFVIPLDLPEDKWVTAIELRPEARSVVHHVLYFLDESGAARKLDGQDGQPGFRGMRFRVSGRLGGYVPGAAPQHLPANLAYPLPKGSDLVLQTHFHPSGKAVEEQFTVGLFFADKRPDKTLANIQVPPAFGRTMKIDIPAGEKDYRIKDTFKVPVDSVAHSVGGHAHYLCEEMKLTATLPDGTSKSLLYINDWDLDWQDRYTFKEPVSLPAGTILTSELTYDNSADNPDNPTIPPVRVKWGRESTDEMGSITLMVTAADEAEVSQLVRASRMQQLAGATGDVLKNIIGAAYIKNLPQVVKRLDANADGKLQEKEIPEHIRPRLLDRLDLDKDRQLNKSELQLLYDWAKNQSA